MATARKENVRNPNEPDEDERAEIKLRIKAIQRGWSDEERADRYYLTRLQWMPQTVCYHNPHVRSGVPQCSE